jgi:hypothetical protein
MWEYDSVIGHQHRGSTHGTSDARGMAEGTEQQGAGHRAGRDGKHEGRDPGSSLAGTLLGSWDTCEIQEDPVPPHEPMV